MKVQLAKPADHTDVVRWPLTEPLSGWTIDGLHDVMGLHRHEVRIVETADVTYVVKELPDDLAEREWRLLRELADVRCVVVLNLKVPRSWEKPNNRVLEDVTRNFPNAVVVNWNGISVAGNARDEDGDPAR